ncbi:DUF4189 domain-containing protein [Achromobacter aloeverae]
MIGRGLFGLLLCLACFSSAWAQCAPGIPCAGNPAGIPPDRPNSPYYNGQGDNGGYQQPAPPARAATWAAFAADAKGRLSWAYEQRSEAEASRAAVASCRKADGQDCQVMETFSEACGALAVDNQNKVYSGFAAYPRDAGRYAVEKCDKANPTGQCRLVTFAICTGARYSDKFEAETSEHAAQATAEELDKFSRGYRALRQFWGAIAVGPRDDTVRISVDELTQKDAEDHAMARCQGGACRILATFNNTCVATGYPLDPSKNDEYLTPETNPDPNVLNQAFRAKCDAKYGKQCAVMVRCTGASYPSTAPFAKQQSSSAAPAQEQTPQTPQAHRQDNTPTPPLANKTPQAQAQPKLRPSFQACVNASGGVTASMNDCIGTELAFQDARLNKAYGQLRQVLDQPATSTLRDQERAWIKSRDSDCAPDTNGGTAAMLDSNSCVLNRTADRAAELEAMLARR